MPNYQIQAGTLLEAFETIGDWTPAGTAGGSVAVDTSIFQEGAGSLKITSVNGNYYGTKTINVNLSKAGVIAIDVYFEDITKITSGALIYLSSTTGFTSYFSTTLTDLHNGWNRFLIKRTRWTNTGSEDWANTMIRLRVRIDVTDTTSAYFDNLKYGVWHRPKVIFTCDDGWALQHSELYTYAKSKYPNFKATCYINGSSIGTGSYMTVSQLTDLYNAGWDISNHVYTHTNLTTLSTQAEMENLINLNKVFLQDNGFTRNNMHLHFCYPNGGYNDTTIAAVAAQGSLTARTVIATANYTNAPGIASNLLITRNLGNTTTLDSIKADVDTAIACGGTLIIYSHRFITPATTTTEFPVADMQALVNYIMKYHEGGVLDLIPLSEWYRGLNNPRKLV
jgi:peptidoglycan/xylan/chitin deacetylase (PgdA/CDA1 family)